jgi:hypothetical protein
MKRQKEISHFEFSTDQGKVVWRVSSTFKKGAGEAQRLFCRTMRWRHKTPITIKGITGIFFKEQEAMEYVEGFHRLILEPVQFDDFLIVRLDKAFQPEWIEKAMEIPRKGCASLIKRDLELKR